MYSSSVLISRPALPSLTVRVLSSRSSPSSSVTVVVPSVTEGSVFSLTASLAYSSSIVRT